VEVGGRKEGDEEKAKSFVIPTPIAAERVWPIMVLRGWASGEERALYSRIAEAPWRVVLVSSLAEDVFLVDDDRARGVRVEEWTSSYIEREAIRMKQLEQVPLSC
jgi:cytochrome oxidase assembly protein ShyY1